MSDDNDEYVDPNGGVWHTSREESVRNLHKLFNDLTRKSKVVIHYPPLIDPVSAFQNGMMDAILHRVTLSFVLIAAEERVLNDNYCQGFAKGCNLPDENDTWRFSL